MKIPHGMATPHRHQNNGTKERTAQTIVEGVRTLFEHAGLPSCFLPLAVRHWCFASNVATHEGDSAWNKRHGKNRFDQRKVFAFGCCVEYLARPKDVKAMPKFETRASPGILVGYTFQPGGEWKGEYQVFPLRKFDD